MNCSQFTINTLDTQPIAPPSSTLSSSAGPSRSSDDATSASILLLDFDITPFFRKIYPEPPKLGPSGKRKATGNAVYRCLHCPADTPWESKQKSNARNHARKVHSNIVINSRSNLGVDSNSDGVEEPFQKPRIDHFYALQASESSLRRAFDRRRYIQAWVGLLTRRRLPFSAVTWDEMSELVLASNPAVEDLLLTSRHAAMRHISANFDLYRTRLRSLLESSISLVHISSDLWTSPHRHGILALCARWIDADLKPRRALLGMPECKFSHSGEHQAELMLEVLEIYGLSRRLGYHTSDNATSNDTCLQHLSRLLKEKHGGDFNPKLRRIRCVAHILNLSLQAFLLASSKEALIAALEAADDTTGDAMYEQFYEALNTAAERESSQLTGRKRLAKRGRSSDPNYQRLANFSGWRQISALRKIHHLAVWLRTSSIHSDQWDMRVGLRLGIDNDTRWNSWYKLLSNALRKKAEIRQFFLDFERELGDNILTISDWEFIERTQQFLQPFAAATLLGEGAGSNLSHTLMIMDALLHHYEKAKKIYSAEATYDPHLLHCVDMGWFVLNKYYILTDETPAYTAALLLDPSKRLKYIQHNWDIGWIDSVVEKTRMFWEENYKNAGPVGGTSLSAKDESPYSRRPRNDLDALFDEITVWEESNPDVDDFDTFVKSPPIRITCSPLLWWLNPERIKAYPRLSRMAIDILSIPPESTDPESAFSGGRRTLSWDRESMLCENVEKVECIGNWIRSGLITLSIEGGNGIIVDTAIDVDVDREVDDELD
ncbi:hypothetical protein VFPPC_18318 [Pochonia chlamydosporia 170]|uniref:Ribonuclease H-like protein n=1 Tax=Pochonia chlamydosporia 170 TaxID=1380566 RepID=A0A219ANU4_METCM|nr:Ribonuclease H-like protein [Pochonia chlamydosporia 170]XP_022285075.1 hypothetical protein VFPPC_18318 [Pochonia chlamydosporia 170]OWT42391.1 Ribonuclease H-like protein [Pochonia chlamydosporia 170]OWT42579.1 hypothetical protein VFPPC_18318 [Pochonia chlamydosporia 170]